MERLDKRDFSEVITVSSMDQISRSSLFTSWLNTGDPVNMQKCFQLIVQLRKRRLTDEAAQFSQDLLDKEKNLPNYNMFLITQFDYCEKHNDNWEKLLHAFTECWDYCRPQQYEPNIIATLLKTANKLIELTLMDSTQFLSIYENWSEISRNNNPFILCQYYIYLINSEQYSSVIESYNNLDEDIKHNHVIFNLFKSCESKVDISNNGTSSVLQPPTKILTLIYSNENGAELSNTLSYFGLQAKQITMPCENLITALNQKTFRANFAVIILADEFSKDISKWSFAIGYCIHKFSKDNVLIFHKNPDTIVDSSLSWLLSHTQINKINYDIDIIKQLGEKGIISA